MFSRTKNTPPTIITLTVCQYFSDPNYVVLLISSFMLEQSSLMLHISDLQSTASSRVYLVVLAALFIFIKQVVRHFECVS